MLTNGTYLSYLAVTKLRSTLLVPSIGFFFVLRFDLAFGFLSLMKQVLIEDAPHASRVFVDLIVHTFEFFVIL